MDAPDAGAVLRSLGDCGVRVLKGSSVEMGSAHDAPTPTPSSEPAPSHDVSGDVANGILKALLVAALLALGIGALVWGYQERQRQEDAYIHGTR
jgi:hypothetical protein